jgi:hypothetical protein
MFSEKKQKKIHRRKAYKDSESDPKPNFKTHVFKENVAFVSVNT